MPGHSCVNTIRASKRKRWLPSARLISTSENPCGIGMIARIFLTLAPVGPGLPGFVVTCVTPVSWAIPRGAQRRRLHLEPAASTCPEHLGVEFTKAGRIHTQVKLYECSWLRKDRPCQMLRFLWVPLSSVLYPIQLVANEPMTCRSYPYSSANEAAVAPEIYMTQH